MTRQGYYTETRQDVSMKIEEGLTEFFGYEMYDSPAEAQEAAEAYAKQKRSYAYPVFDFDKKQIGFGVPR